AQEVASNAPVVVVSHATAERFWPGLNPIGQHFGIAVGSENSDEKSESAKPSYRQFEVVGVARDTRSRWLWQRDEGFVYMPLPLNQQTAYLLIQTRSDPAGPMSVIRGLATSIDPELRVSMRRIEDSLTYQTAPFQALAWLSGVLGALALLLASLGLYGVTSFLVARRTREIGIRMALGAQAGDVVRMFLFQGLRLTAIGVFLGLLGGAVISQLLVSVLIDLSPFNPLAFITVSGFLSLVAVVAILSAARRATRVDPIVALRYE
ncbi:MAG TPA: FtsX-like permease family protein, partial [Pyrinomonadaceae bacterium]